MIEFVCFSTSSMDFLFAGGIKTVKTLAIPKQIMAIFDSNLLRKLSSEGFSSADSWLLEKYFRWIFAKKVEGYANQSKTKFIAISRIS